MPLHIDSNVEPWSTVFLVFAALAAAGMCFVHVMLAFAVAGDIGALREKKRDARFLGSAGWSFFTLVTGPLGFAFYWVMHHSSLRDPQTDRTLE